MQSKCGRPLRIMEVSDSLSLTGTGTLRCVQPLQGALKYSVSSRHDVTPGNLNRQVWFDADPHEFPAVREAIMLGANASGAAPGQFECERLSGTAAGSFPDQTSSMSLRESDNHVFSSRKRSWTN